VPDYSSILQEFLWQTEDLVPEYPRVIKFLNFWKEHIDAAVKEVQIAGIANKDRQRFRNVDMVLRLN
jgi:uncharacterized protein Usg